MVSGSTMEKVTKLAESPIEAVFTDPSYGKVFTIYLQDECLNYCLELLLTFVLWVSFMFLCKEIIFFMINKYIVLILYYI